MDHVPTYLILDSSLYPLEIYNSTTRWWLEAADAGKLLALNAGSNIHPQCTCIAIKAVIDYRYLQLCL
jgi:hypothetical protein